MCRCGFRGKERGTSKVAFVGCGDPLPYSPCLIVLAGSILLRYSSLLHIVPSLRWVLPACGCWQKHPFLSSFLVYLQPLRIFWACNFCLQQTLPSTVRLWSRQYRIQIWLVPLTSLDQVCCASLASLLLLVSMG